MTAVDAGIRRAGARLRGTHRRSRRGDRACRSAWRRPRCRADRRQGSRELPGGRGRAPAVLGRDTRSALAARRSGTRVDGRRRSRCRATSCRCRAARRDATRTTRTRRSSPSCGDARRVLRAADAQLLAPTVTPDRCATGVSTDTRTIAPGSLFVALRGERFDGHAFAADARRGAAQRRCWSTHAVDAAAPQIVVADTRRALGQAAARMARALRRCRSSPSPAATARRRSRRCWPRSWRGVPTSADDGRRAWLATRGNLNNDIGVPLMLFELRRRTASRSFELGMNHPGEIALLAAIARPTVALVNNAQREHQEFMDSVEATAHENGAVITLAAAGRAWRCSRPTTPAPRSGATLAGTRRVVDFALARAGDGHCARGADGIRRAPRRRRADGVPSRSNCAVAGAHNVHNALAAAACALAAGIRPADIAAGLASFMPVNGRGVRHVLPSGAR